MKRVPNSVGTRCIRCRESPERSDCGRHRKQCGTLRRNGLRSTRKQPESPRSNDWNRHRKQPESPNAFDRPGSEGPRVPRAIGRAAPDDLAALLGRYTSCGACVVRDGSNVSPFPSHPLRLFDQPIRVGMKGVAVSTNPGDASTGARGARREAPRMRAALPRARAKRAARRGSRDGEGFHAVRGSSPIRWCRSVPAVSGGCSHCFSWTGHAACDHRTNDSRSD
jgi:hypothetical protein